MAGPFSSYAGITSSARAIIDGGMANPIAFAAFMLIVSSTRLGSSTGMSPGRVPLRMRSIPSYRRRAGRPWVPDGRVGAGIVVRASASAPDVSSVDALKRALLAADAIVYNTASTGIYLDRLFEKLGILDALKPKTTRYPDGASVMEHVIRASGTLIGFGAITEIRAFEPKGLKLVGPLPADVQNYTSYEAAVMTGAKNADAARAVLRLLASPAGKAAFVAAGIE